MSEQAQRRTAAAVVSAPYLGPSLPSAAAPVLLLHRPLAALTESTFLLRACVCGWVPSPFPLLSFTSPPPFLRVEREASIARIAG